MATKSEKTAKVLNALSGELGIQGRTGIINEAKPTLESIKAYGQVITSFEPTKNQWLSALWNRIIMVLASEKNWTNKLKRFKRSPQEYGETIEEVYVELAKPYAFDSAKAKDIVFKVVDSDVRSAFHTMNYQIQYGATTTQIELNTAFLSLDGVMNLVDRIINSVYQANEYDEFIVMKYLIARLSLDGVLHAISIPAVTKDNMYDIVEVIKKTSNDFEFRNPTFSYEHVRNFATKEEQFLISTSEFDAKNDVNVLASAFNMEKAEFLGNRSLIDSFSIQDDERLQLLFPDYVAFTSEEKTLLDKIPAVLIDEKWFMVYDNAEATGSIENPAGAYTNFFYTVFKTFSASPFANAVVFTEDEVKVNSIAINPNTLTLSKGGRIQVNATVETSGFADKRVSWVIDGQESDKTFITTSGLLVVASDETATTITITATSLVDSTKTATATVTVA